MHCWEDASDRSLFIMKTSTKLIIAGTTIGVVVAGALIAKHMSSVGSWIGMER